MAAGYVGFMALPASFRSLLLLLLAVGSTLFWLGDGTDSARASEPQASVRATEATTGESGAVIAKPVCGAPRPGHVSCLATILVNKSTHAFIHPNLHRAGSFVSPYRTASEAIVTPTISGGTPPETGTPAFFQQAYDLAGLASIAGSGDTVGIVDAYGDSTAASDLAVFRSAYGLPSCTAANNCLKVVNEYGQTTPLPANDQGWATETSLDLDAVSSVCPNCKIDLIQAASDNFGDLETAEGEADALGANQISNSWGGDATDSPASEGLTNAAFSFSNAATLAASGDSGYLGAGDNQYPASFPGVTSVGGTSLLTPSDSQQGSSRGITETAWGNGQSEGTGSGCNAYISQPTYQAGIGCAGRAYNDISADADPETGLSIYDTEDGGWEDVGGTSLATPMIAAYYALVGKTTANGSPAWDYSNASLLNDITAGTDNGSNGSCSTFICNARVGYDGPTGEGSIAGDVVQGPPGVAGPSQPNGGYEAASTSTSVTLAGGVYPNQLDTSYYWQYGTTTAYGEQSATTDVGTGSSAPAGSGGLVPVTTSLTGLVSGTTYHYRLVAQNNYGGVTTTTYGYDYTFRYTGSTGSSDTGPSISSVGATSVTATTASFSGTVNPEGQATTYCFEWGTSSAYGNSTQDEAAGTGSTNISVTGAAGDLTPDTLYHYALVATDEPQCSDANLPGAETTISSDETFTTLPVQAGAGSSGGLPILSFLTTSSISTTGATVTADVDPDGADTTYSVEWQTTTGSIVGVSNVVDAGSGTSNVPITYQISGLAPNTAYQYIISADNGEGEVSAPPVSFTTLAHAQVAPSLSGVTVTGITSTSATLQGNVDPQGADTSFLFQYGPTSAYGISTTPSDIGTTQATVSLSLTNLQPGTVYHYTLEAINAWGQTSYIDQSFSTLASAPVNTGPPPGNTNPGTGPSAPAKGLTATVKCSKAGACRVHLILSTKRKASKSSVIASAWVTLKKSKTSKLTLDLNAAGRRLLKQKHKFHATLLLANQSVSVLVSNRSLAVSLKQG